MRDPLKSIILRKFVFYVSHEPRSQTKLLGFHCRRENCRKRLWEAAEKCKATVLNYHISPEKIQMLIGGNSEQVTELTQRVVTNTAADHRRRTHQEGPFWRRRFKATLVQHGIHFLRCSLTMDMTMVLQEKCLYLGEWALSGHREITEIRKRYRIIDCDKVAQISGFENYTSMKIWYLQHMKILPAIKFFNVEDLISAMAVGDLKNIELIAQCFSRRNRRIELLADDKFGSSYGLFVSQQAKQSFTRSIK